jgi:hypothetical protein
MTVLDWVHTLSGFFIVASLALGFWVSPYRYLFTAFVGANLFKFGFSRFCLLAVVLKKLGVPETRQGISDSV